MSASASYDDDGQGFYSDDENGREGFDGAANSRMNHGLGSPDDESDTYDVPLDASHTAVAFSAAAASPGGPWTLVGKSPTGADGDEYEIPVDDIDVGELQFLVTQLTSASATAASLNLDQKTAQMAQLLASFVQRHPQLFPPSLREQLRTGFLVCGSQTAGKSKLCMAILGYQPIFYARSGTCTRAPGRYISRPDAHPDAQPRDPNPIVTVAWANDVTPPKKMNIIEAAMYIQKQHEELERNKAFRSDELLVNIYNNDPSVMGTFVNDLPGFVGRDNAEAYDAVFRNNRELYDTVVKPPGSGAWLLVAHRIDTDATSGDWNAMRKHDTSGNSRTAIAITFGDLLSKSIPGDIAAGVNKARSWEEVEEALCRPFHNMLGSEVPVFLVASAAMTSEDYIREVRDANNLRAAKRKYENETAAATQKMYRYLDELSRRNRFRDRDGPAKQAFFAKMVGIETLKEFINRKTREAFTQRLPAFLTALKRVLTQIRTTIEVSEAKLNDEDGTFAQTIERFFLNLDNMFRWFFTGKKLPLLTKAFWSTTGPEFIRKETVFDNPKAFHEWTIALGRTAVQDLSAIHERKFPFVPSPIKDEKYQRRAERHFEELHKTSPTFKRPAFSGDLRVENLLREFNSRLFWLKPLQFGENDMMQLTRDSFTANVHNEHYISTSVSTHFLNVTGHHLNPIVARRFSHVIWDTAKHAYNYLLEQLKDDFAPLLKKSLLGQDIEAVIKTQFYDEQFENVKKCLDGACERICRALNSNAPALLEGALNCLPYNSERVQQYVAGRPTACWSKAFTEMIDKCTPSSPRVRLEAAATEISGTLSVPLPVVGQASVTTSVPVPPVVSSVVSSALDAAGSAFTPPLRNAKTPSTYRRYTGSNPLLDPMLMSVFEQQHRATRFTPEQATAFYLNMADLNDSPDNPPRLQFMHDFTEEEQHHTNYIIARQLATRQVHYSFAVSDQLGESSHVLKTADAGDFWIGNALLRLLVERIERRMKETDSKELTEEELKTLHLMLSKDKGKAIQAQMPLVKKVLNEAYGDVDKKQREQLTARVVKLKEKIAPLTVWEEQLMQLQTELNADARVRGAMAMASLVAPALSSSSPAHRGHASHLAHRQGPPAAAAAAVGPSPHGGGLGGTGADGRNPDDAQLEALSSAGDEREELKSDP